MNIKTKDYVYKSLILATAVTFLTFTFKLSVANILLFSCLAASAMILVNMKRYSRASLKVVVGSYLLTGLVAISISLLFNQLSFTVMIFLTMFLSSFFLYLFDFIHPPAMGNALAFLLSEHSLLDMAVILLAVLLLLILIRLMTYLYFGKFVVEVDKK